MQLLDIPMATLTLQTTGTFFIALLNSIRAWKVSSLVSVVRITWQGRERGGAKGAGEREGERAEGRVKMREERVRGGKVGR